MPARIAIRSDTGVTRASDIFDHGRRQGKSLMQMLPVLFPPHVDITHQTLAEVLGISDGATAFSNISDTERFFLLNTTGTTLTKRHAGEREFTELQMFTAKYLVALIDKLLASLSQSRERRSDDLLNKDMFVLQNAYIAMLIMLPNQPYLYKYWLSRKKCASAKWQLPGVLASHLLRAAPTWDNPIIADTENVAGIKILGVLAFSLGGRVKGKSRAKAIPSHIRDGLKPWIDKWRKKNDELGVVARLLWATLYEDHDASNPSAEVISLRAQMNADRCALYTCRRTENLRACGRCQAVKYCCVEHQREHWRSPYQSPKQHGHKSFCFETEY